jgi:hypothetical protein
VLRLAQLAPDLVESYTGPPELAAAAEAAQPDTTGGLRDGVLPGRGDARRDDQGWCSTQLVAPELLHDALAALAAELRGLSHERFSLPADEVVEVAVVGDVHWAGHAEYLGAMRSRIAINRDLPIPSMRLLELVSHEAYPGHHTEAICTEAALVDGAGRLELCIYSTPRPRRWSLRAWPAMRSRPSSDLRPSRWRRRACVLSGSRTTPRRQ